MIYVSIMYRSLEMFDSHVKGYHSVSLHEFAAYIGKTNVHYRCQFCMQETLYDKLHLKQNKISCFVAES